MGLTCAQLTPSSTRLEGFTTHKVDVKEAIEFEVTLGSSTHASQELVKFHVVDVELTYNAILGVPLQVAFDMVVSLPHQQVKFPTLTGVVEVRSDPRSRLAYLIKTKKRYSLSGVHCERMSTVQEEYREILVHPSYLEKK